MDSRFFERKCFVTTSESLLKFMQEQEDDSSLTFNMEKDTKEIFLYSPAYDVEYNEDDIIERVSNELNNQGLRDAMSIFETELKQ